MSAGIAPNSAAAENGLQISGDTVRSLLTTFYFCSFFFPPLPWFFFTVAASSPPPRVETWKVEVLHWYKPIQGSALVERASWKT